jgi:hypothetical protein
MNKNEFIERIGGKDKIDSECAVYSAYCRECVTYHSPTNAGGGMVVSGVSTGLMDGKEQEFKTVKDAQAAIDEHKANNPLHEPKLSGQSPVIEYLTHTDKHMIRYRTSARAANPDDDFVHVYSVNGYHIASDKCAYECKLCNAIYESKEDGYSRAFRTGDPRCNNETHYDNSRTGLRSLQKICVCPTIYEEQELEDSS